MKIAAGRTESFVQKPDAHIRVMLVYGPDNGLVRERGLLLAKSACPSLDDPFRVATLTPSMIAEDPARLLDEMAAQSLSGGRRLVYVQGATESVALALGQMLAQPATTDTLLVIEAGDLGKNSKLRALCEDTADAAAIACYAEDAEGRRRTLGNLLREQNIAIEGDALELLAASVPPDRLALRSELDKLITYALGRQKITVDDVQQALGDGSAADLDALVMAVGGGLTGEVGALTQRLYGEAVSFVMILRSVQRHLLRLQLARAHMEKGMSASEALKQLRPPVFWKHETAMARQLQRWTVERCGRALAHLAEAEAQCKSTGIPAEAVCAQALVTVSR